MDTEEEPVFKLVDAHTRGVQRVRPRMRNVGLVHVAAALVLGGALALGTMQGCAGNDVQVLPSGVYVAMNGRCFAWDDGVKNKELGIFESRQK